MKPQIILATALLTFALPAPAQISTDGTLGPTINLDGPNFQIGAELGQQHGPNLFHSFRDFNLSSHESATFSGPNNVQNILSRVTGGNPSNIDGLFRSTISGANVYFLNPYGIMFGPNARLDVQGSFHASTADYLRLGEDGRFDVRNPSDSILTVAPIESFGFLDDSIASISLEGKGEINKTDWDGQPTGLSVSDGQILSLIGGNIEITNGNYYQMGGTKHLGSLTAPSGRINLIGVASSGEIVLENPDLTSFDELGEIIISNQSLIAVNGGDTGRIFIRGKSLNVTNDSQIQAERKPSKNNPLTTLSNDNRKVSIDIEVETLSFSNKIYVSANSYTIDNAGDIVIKADDLFLREEAWINNQAYSTGNSGNIILTANNILLEGAGIVTLTHHTGDAGDIYIKANNLITITGAVRRGGWASGIVSVSDPSQPGIIGGFGGDIVLEARELIITKGGKINSSTIAAGDMQSNQAGNIDIQVSDTIRISAVNPYGENENGFGSGISVRSKGANAGNAGNISVTANALFITDGAAIRADTSGRGQGGNINLNISEQIYISGDSAHITLTEPTDEQYSQIKFQQEFSDYQKDIIAVSGIYGNSLSSSNDAGEAGTINIKANNLSLTDDALINSSTQQASGGNITITIPNLLYLQEAGITTSVRSGIGSGGNITIENPQFVVLDKGQITAQADAGHGGNIRIDAEKLIASPDSLASASSRLGLDGDVNIESPTVNLDDFLVVLPGSDDEVELQLPKGCTVEDILNPKTRFLVRTVREGRLKSPEGFME